MAILNKTINVNPLVCLVPLVFCTWVSVVTAGVPETLLEEYALQTGATFSAEKGKQLWNTVFVNNKLAQQRSCASCHTENLTLEGKHTKTKKLIEPIAPSVNTQRLTKRKTIEKWFRRNCKWTMSRECTPEEKGHILKFIQGQ